MGFLVPERPYALILGSHEDDVLMTEGTPGLKEQISVGLLELADDITQRLPAFLSAYDVVILGEGSLSYVKNMLEDMSGVQETLKRGGPLGGLGGGLRERLGFLRSLQEGLTGVSGGGGSSYGTTTYGSDLF